MWPFATDLIQVPIWTLPKRTFSQTPFGKVFGTCITGEVTKYHAGDAPATVPTNVRDYIFSPSVQTLIDTGSLTCMYDIISNSNIAMGEFSLFLKPMENFVRDPTSTEYKRRTDNAPITFKMRTDEVAQASLACIANIGIPLLQALVDYKTTLF